MSEKLYRVVEVNWNVGSLVEVDIGSTWKSLRMAKAQMKMISVLNPNKTYSIQAKF